jgi:hypothetical protein
MSPGNCIGGDESINIEKVLLAASERRGAAGNSLTYEVYFSHNENANIWLEDVNGSCIVDARSNNDKVIVGSLVVAVDSHYVHGSSYADVIDLIINV